MRRWPIALAGMLVVVVALAVGATTLLSPAPEKPSQDEAEVVEVLDHEAATEAEGPQAEEGETTSEPEPDEPTFDASATKVSETSQSGIGVTAPEGFLETSAFAQVDAEISALVSTGHHVGVVLRDLQTGCTISYNADERLYPASSIKAAYCTWVLETNGGSAGMADVMERCLVDSSNEDYETLIGTFGLSAYGSWLSAHGATAAAADGSYYFYPYISAGELASLWEEIWRYGTSGEAGGAELAGYLSRTGSTPIGELLRGSYDVWAKPGWFPDNGELVATNDAGVIFSDCGAYVLVVMTDLSADLDGLLPLIDALNVAHGTMCGGSAESLL